MVSEVFASGSTVSATHESGEASIGPGAGASIWYSFDANVTGTFLVTTSGSTFDTLLGVYASTDGTLAGAQLVGGSGARRGVQRWVHMLSSLRALLGVFVDGLRQAGLAGVLSWVWLHCGTACRCERECVLALVCLVAARCERRLRSRVRHHQLCDGVRQLGRLLRHPSGRPPRLERRSQRHCDPDTRLRVAVRQRDVVGESNAV